MTRKATTLPPRPRANSVDRAIGAEIRRRREALGMNQTALGKALGLSFQQVQKYEKGGNRVSASRLIEIAHALGCHASEILSAASHGSIAKTASSATHSDLRAANIARQAEWDPSAKISLSYRGNELGGECGEAQNIIKKLERERLGIRGSRATVPQLADELADVVICTDLIAMAAGIDLQQAVERKFNATSTAQNLTTRLLLSPAPASQQGAA